MECMAAKGSGSQHYFGVQIMKDLTILSINNNNTLVYTLGTAVMPVLRLLRVTELHLGP